MLHSVAEESVLKHVRKCLQVYEGQEFIVALHMCFRKTWLTMDCTVFLSARQSCIPLVHGPVLDAGSSRISSCLDRQLGPTIVGVVKDLSRLSRDGAITG